MNYTALLNFTSFIGTLEILLNMKISYIITYQNIR